MFGIGTTFSRGTKLQVIDIFKDESKVFKEHNAILKAASLIVYRIIMLREQGLSYPDLDIESLPIQMELNEGCGETLELGDVLSSILSLIKVLLPIDNTDMEMVSFSIVSDVKDDVLQLSLHSLTIVFTGEEE